MEAMLEWVCGYYGYYGAGVHYALRVSNSYLMTAAINSDSPLMEPNLSRVTELLMTMKLAENVMDSATLIRKANITNTPHNTSFLQDQ